MRGLKALLLVFCLTGTFLCAFADNTHSKTVVIEGKQSATQVQDQNKKINDSLEGEDVFYPDFYDYGPYYYPGYYNAPGYWYRYHNDFENEHRRDQHGDSHKGERR